MKWKRWGYPIKYIGKTRKYLVNNKWVNHGQVPERIKYLQSEKHYFSWMFNKMKKRHKKHKDSWSGEFEFKDRDDLLNHLYEQRKKYGNKCPITHQTFTTTRFKQGIDARLGGQKTETGVVNTNISPDRLFSPITYTKQNVLFTCVTWNLKKGNSKFYELPSYFKKELTDRFYKILHERFPEYEDIGWEAIDGYDWSGEK